MAWQAKLMVVDHDVQMRIEGGGKQHVVTQLKIDGRDVMYDVALLPVYPSAWLAMQHATTLVKKAVEQEVA